jgi:uncharacterized protein YyaL (SSP411 family)
VKKCDAFLDDYAFLAQALLALGWKDRAAEVTKSLIDRFGDSEIGGFYFSDRSAKDLIVRQMVASDSPLPSGNAVAAMALLELDQADLAKRAIQPFAPQFDRAAESMSSMVQAAMQYVRKHGPIVVPATARQDAERVAPPEQIAAGVVAMRAAMPSATLIELRIDILDGFHINAHQASKGLIPTTLKVAGVDANEIERIDYPPGEQRRFAFADAPMRVYEDTATIAIHFKRPVTTSKLTLSLTYQACDDSTCLPPVTKRMEVKLSAS